MQYRASICRARPWLGLVLTLISVFKLAAVSAAPEGSPWGANYFPNIELTTHEGKKVRFYDDLIKGKVVAFNFIFTHCADSCPMETANLSKIQTELGDRIGRDVYIYSISINPKQDTPKVLKAYAKKFKAKPGWLFLTGKSSDIKLLRQKFGLYNEDEKNGKQLSAHSTSMMVGNETTGQWMKRSAFDEPKVLAWVLGKFLQTDQTVAAADAQLTQASYREAQQIEHMSEGERLFRSRCDSCHSLGTQEGFGPGLAGVTQKRDPVWLAKWLKAPDVLLQQQDPLAMALYKQYKQVIMPNLRLSDKDVSLLLAYLAEQTPASNP